MITIYLKFESINQAIETLIEHEPELLWMDGDTPRIKGSPDFAVALLGTLSHRTGIILEDGTEEIEPVAGYHVNLNLANRDMPDYLLPFQVFPVTPSVSF